MRAIVMTHPLPKDIKSFFKLEPDDFMIAVDQAVISAYKQRMKIDLAVGDFDSLTNKGILRSLETVELKPEKDVTDTFQALVEAKNRNVDQIILIGGFGGKRIEHFIGHLTLFDAFPHLVMKDEYTTITRLDKGTYPCTFDGYTSFYAFPDATISLKNFKYELDQYHLKTYDPICISNETKKDAQINVHQVSVLMVQSLND
ncbi:thiamine diphosphokinase [Mycoplasmatota bacterium]|nr:thiamine diphosphokinase [Mycoplasmatota bacterium]